MISDKKAEANRLNAQKSTGPRTARGKSLTGLNAVTHGAFAIQRVLLCENEKEYQQLLAAVVAETVPASAIEAMLVDQMIGDMWRLKRLERAELTHLERIRKSKLESALCEMSDSEFEATRSSVVDEDVLRSATQSRRREKEAALFQFNGLALLAGRAIKAPAAERDQTEVLKFGKQKLADADDLGTLILDAMSDPEKGFPYTSLDHVRRSIVRDIMRKYADLAKLQQHRQMIETAAADKAERNGHVLSAIPQNDQLADISMACDGG